MENNAIMRHVQLVYIPRFWDWGVFKGIQVGAFGVQLAILGLWEALDILTCLGCAA